MNLFLRVLLLEIASLGSHEEKTKFGRTAHYCQQLPSSFPWPDLAGAG